MLIFQSIIVYTLLTVIMCLGAYMSQKVPKFAVWSWIPIVAFTLVFGLRYGVGMDYNNYLDIYAHTEVASPAWIKDVFHLELLPIIIIYVCHFFGTPAYVFFSIIAFIQIFFLYKAFKNEGNILIYIYLMLIFSGICMLGFMNIMRQMVATCIFLYSLQYIRDNKVMPYWACCILAFLFHKSAIILFPMYFIWARKKGLLNSPIVELGLLALSLMSIFLIGWQEALHSFDRVIVALGYGSYISQMDTYMDAGGRGIGIADTFAFVIYAMIVLHSREMKEHIQSPIFNILYDMFIVGSCLAYFFKGSMLAERMLVYFTISQFIVVAYFLRYLYETKRQNVKQYARYLLVLMFVFFQYSRFLYYEDQNTGAYVSYFQTELHDMKDHQREELLEKYLK